MIVRPFVAVALSAAVLCLSVAGTAVAEPPVVQGISVRERWKVGDVFTRTGDESETVRMKITAEEKVVSDVTRERRTTYNTVGRVVEVDAVGHATRLVLYFVAWNHVGRGGQDGSLAGLRIEVTGRGKARAFRVLTPDVKPSEGAQRWLNDRFGRPREGAELDGKDSDDLLEPSRPLAVGETWTPDVAAIAKMLSARLPVDTDKVTAEARLEDVAGGLAKVVVRLKVPLRGLEAGEGSPMLAWKQGGTLETTVHSSRSTSNGFEGTQVRETKLEGIADAQGADVDFDLVSRTEVVVKAGGTMPPLPDVPAEPATPGAPQGK